MAKEPTAQFVKMINCGECGHMIENWQWDKYPSDIAEITCGNPDCPQNGLIFRVKIPTTKAPMKVIEL